MKLNYGFLIFWKEALMEVMEAFRIFSRTSSRQVDAIGCVLARAVKDIDLCKGEEGFCGFFLSASEDEVKDALLHLIWARWASSLLILKFDVKVAASGEWEGCGHWFSEHLRAAEHLLLTARWFDFMRSNT